MSGTLPAEDPLNDSKPSDPAEQQRSDAERAELRQLHGLGKAQQIAQRKVPAADRYGASPYYSLVKYVFGFEYQAQSSMVFDRCVEDQRAKRTSNSKAIDAAIIKAAIKEAAVSQVRELPAKAVVDIAPARAKDGFVLLVGRVTDTGVQVLDEATLTDNVILQAVSALGSKTPLDVDPACEFLGRVLELGSIIRDRQDLGVNVKTDRMIAIKPGADGKPQLVVSVNKAEAGPVLYARPHDAGFLSLDRGACVLAGTDRRDLENKIGDVGRRSLYSVKLETEPKTPSGKPSNYALNW